MTDIRQSLHWANFMEDLGWGVDKVGRNGQFVYYRKIPLFGTVIKAPRLTDPLPLSEIDSFARAKKATFVKLEPFYHSDRKDITDNLTKFGFKGEKWALHPTKTIVVNLRKNDEDLLSDMEKDTRYGVRSSQRRGVRIVKSSDLRRFLKLYQKTAKRKKFWVAEKELSVLWDIFFNEGKAFILIAQWNKADVAGCLILHHEKTAYYYHAASIPQFRELYAPYLLIWEAMQTAKSLRLKEFDLEGLFDSRIPATKNWRGFSHFKRGFGGDEVTLLGSFAKSYNPVLSLLFSLNKFAPI